MSIFPEEIPLIKLLNYIISNLSSKKLVIKSMDEDIIETIRDVLKLFEIISTEENKKLL